jgi:hypothetical protein
MQTTRISHYRRLLTNNSTATAGSLTSPADLSAEPEGTAGYIKCGEAARGTWIELAEFQLFGAGSENDTGVCKFYGVAFDGLAWVHTLLCSVAFTVGTKVGTITGSSITSTDRLADTITASVGTDGVNLVITSPTNNEPARVVIDTQGFEYLYPVVARDSGLTSANARWRAVTR